MKKKDRGYDCVTQILISKLSAKKEQLNTRDFVINYEELANACNLFNGLKEFFSTVETERLVIDKKNENGPTPTQAGYEIKGFNQQSLSPVKPKASKQIKEPCAGNLGCRKTNPAKKNKPKEAEVVSFGCNVERQKLHKVLFLLSKQVGLLKDATQLNDLVDVFYSKKVKPGSMKFHLGECDNTQFAYILDRMKPFFDSLNCRNVGRSRLFISKDGNDITEDSLYSAKKRNKYNPKKKSIIDAILKLL